MIEEEEIQNRQQRDEQMDEKIVIRKQVACGKGRGEQNKEHQESDGDGDRQGKFDRKPKPGHRSL